jgi:SAM-dependent methyltransferase
VLDVGAGEGADAVWLARQGWTVTAVEPSGVALARARAHGAEAGVDVTWVHAGILEMPGGPGRHDLVSAQYPAIPASDEAIAALLGAVTPGGTLLFVHHDMRHHDHGSHAGDAADHTEHAAGGHGHGHDHEGEGPGFDPDDFVMPGDVAARLDDGWEVEVHEIRDRPAVDLPDDARHVRDIVLRVRRRQGPSPVDVGPGQRHAGS